MRAMDLVLLPATAPDDDRFGRMPEAVPGHVGLRVHAVRFPRQVWYDRATRAEAVAQIGHRCAAPVVLAGFSKSGIGAWNIALEHPGLVAATIIFDAPVARRELPPWGTAGFYADDADWQADLPLARVPRWTASVAGTHRLVLVAGALFHAEMHALSTALQAASVDHDLLGGAEFAHRWDSGWIAAGLAAVFGAT